MEGINPKTLFVVVWSLIFTILVVLIVAEIYAIVELDSLPEVKKEMRDDKSKETIPIG